MGVLSKYKLMGAFKIRSIISSCRRFVPYQEKYINERHLNATNTDVSTVKMKYNEQ